MHILKNVGKNVNTKKEGSKEIPGAKVKSVHRLIITQKAHLGTLDDFLASFINKARESFGRTQNSKSKAEDSTLTISSLICFSLCHPQSKQMT